MSVVKSTLTKREQLRADAKSGRFQQIGKEVGIFTHANDKRRSAILAPGGRNGFVLTMLEFAFQLTEDGYKIIKNRSGNVEEELYNLIGIRTRLHPNMPHMLIPIDDEEWAFIKLGGSYGTLASS